MADKKGSWTYIVLIAHQRQAPLPSVRFDWRYTRAPMHIAFTCPLLPELEIEYSTTQYVQKMAISSTRQATSRPIIISAGRTRANKHEM